ncbi:MAG TPA: MliC family protein [Hyphomonadaceae bacterium]|jgi:membrane-bound inhibitor of C-type lysozyme|nr:MliC family protein [Hyphomonadaceae bacterium]HPN06516.1 MliC family protein [Hyphomonadaceae bacterium]
MKSYLIVTAVLTLGACANITSTPGPAPDPVNAAAVKWTCPSGAIFFTQTTRGGNIEVAAFGETAWLPKVKAASGVRYKSKTAEFWEKGDEATLSGVGGPPQSSCKRTP